MAAGFFFVTRKLQLPFAETSSSNVAAWAAMTFAVVTALAVWGVAHAYPSL